MAYERAPFFNANPAMLMPKANPYALQPMNPTEPMVPPPPDPNLDPETQQKAHASRGAMILTALQQLGAMGQQPKPVTAADLMPDVGGAKGTAFMGSRVVQTKQEQQLRANMAAAQMNQQQQRDLMQQHQQEQARADTINFQKTKFKNDMDIRKMEEQQKKADKQAEMQSPEYILKKTKAELELKQIQETGLQPEIEWNDALAWIKAGADPKQVAATFKIPNEGLLTSAANVASQRLNKSLSSGTGSGTPKATKLPTVTATDLSYAQKILEEAGAAPEPLSQASTGIGVPFTDYVLGGSAPTQEEINQNIQARKAWDKKTAAARSIINAYQAQGEAKAQAFGVNEPPPVAVPQATGDPEIDALVSQGGKIIIEDGKQKILMPDGSKGVIE